MATNVNDTCEEFYYFMLAEDMLSGIADKSSRKVFVGYADLLYQTMLVGSDTIPMTASEERTMEYWKQKWHITATEWYEEHVESKRKKNRYDDDEDEDED